MGHHGQSRSILLLWVMDQDIQLPTHITLIHILILPLSPLLLYLGILTAPGIMGITRAGELATVAVDGDNRS